MLPGRFGYDGPQSLALQGSLDGQTWFGLAKPSCLYAKWMGPHPRWREAGPSQFLFPARKLRYLRLEIANGLKPGHPYNWSVAELFLYGPGKKGTARLAQEAGAILPALANREVKKGAYHRFLGSRAESQIRRQIPNPAGLRPGKQPGGVQLARLGQKAL